MIQGFKYFMFCGIRIRTAECKVPCLGIETSFAVMSTAADKYADSYTRPVRYVCLLDDTVIH